MAKRKAQAGECRPSWELTPGAHVWAYLRHSPSDTQTIDSQKHGMLEWCAELGLVLDRMWIDEGQEGSKEEREQFQAMIAAARQVPRLNARLAMKGTDIRSQVRQAEQVVKDGEQRVESLLKVIEKKGLTTILGRQYDEANKMWLDATARLAALRAASVQAQVKQIDLAGVQRSLDESVSLLETGTSQQKRQLLQQFIERVIVYEKHLTIQFRFSLDSLMELPALQISRPLVGYDSVDGYVNHSRRSKGTAA